MLLPKVKNTIHTYSMLAEGDRVIVAVSGGVDSVVLLDLLKSVTDDYRLELIVAHLNHSIREEEAHRDAEFVRKVASAGNFKCEIGVMDVPQIMEKEGLSLQEAARKARYEFFSEVRNKHKADKVALGHHRDDQVETVVMRFLRGAGAKGLKGMPPVKEGIYIRPLIEITRREIEDYARDKKLPFVTDSTNFKDVYLRNRVRSELIPFLERNYNPNIKEDLIRLSKLMKRDDDLLDSLTAQYSKDIVKVDESVTTKVKSLLSIPEAFRTRVLRHMWEKRSGHSAGIYTYHIESMLALLTSDKPHSSVDLPGGIRFVREYGTVSFTKEKEAPPPPFKHTLNIPGRTVIPERGITLVSEIAERRGFVDEELKVGDDTALFDYDRLNFPLYVRGFQSGDRFKPFGMSGKKKVKDLFIDLKIPKGERVTIPLLFSRDNIVWVVGLRRSDEAMIMNATQRVLKVRIA